jgi:hypothetical protein
LPGSPQPRGDWRAINDLVLDHPFEQATDHTDQVIEASGAFARSSKKECVED